MPTTNRRAGLARHVARLALLAPLSLGLAGCSTAKEPDGGDCCADGCCAADAKPDGGHLSGGAAAAPAHGGAMANVTNKPFAPKPSSGEIGSIERLDPRLDKLLAADARMEKLAEGFDWSEGPVWDRKSNALLFSDVPQNVVYKYQPGQPGVTEYLRPSGYTGTEPRGGEPGSNGLTIDANGHLTLCQHGDRRVARTELRRVFSNNPAGATMPARFVTIADRYEGKRFNSPNDLCFDGKGNLYFTDPPYGLVKNMQDPAKEIPFQGVYRVSPDGKVTLLNRDVTRPNGIALSPDERTLYVASSDPAKAIWMAFPVKDDGTLGDGKVFFDATTMAKDKKNKGMPDGLKVDRQGNLWATGPGGVLVFAPDGTHLGTLRTGEATANCAWGDDGSTLYITADMYLVRVKTLAKAW